MSKKVTIFCASSSDIPKKYVEDTQKLCVRLVSDDYTIVTGGGNGGLMAVIAETTKKLGGKNLGIMPDFMADNAWTNPDISEYTFTFTMAERKERLIRESHAIIVLPGSIGTWEEALEAMTLRKLHQIDLPIIIYNMEGYYDPWVSMMDRAVDEGFMQATDRDYWYILDDLDAVMDVIEKI